VQALESRNSYRGRLAPSPTGDLHVGHARTFWAAWSRARVFGGKLVLRNDDLDSARSRSEYWESAREDLQWLGIEWDEGPEIGGPFAPYRQSERLELYQHAFGRLRAEGYVYVCRCSRKELGAHVSAPHVGQEEPIYPGTCRYLGYGAERGSWRFRCSEGQAVTFSDMNLGPQRLIAGQDFGDFPIMRSDGLPSYQLACVVDDALMGMTEVVRGADLIVSTARQLMLYRALGWEPPDFYHCRLVNDGAGRRLAKRHQSLSLRQLRLEGFSPEQILNEPVEQLEKRHQLCGNEGS
jgi:glutamyl/glutaminyl-tRNA synthetase